MSKFVAPGSRCRPPQHRGDADVISARVRSARRRRAHRRTGIASFDGQALLVFATGFFLSCCIVFGGAVIRPGPGFILIALAGTFLLTVVSFGSLARLRALPLTAQILFAALLALPALQLLPLPPGLWSELPGRALPAAVLKASEGALPWRPMTQSVTGTLGALLCAAWLTGLSLAVLALNHANLRRIMMLLLVLGILDMIVGVVQFTSHGRILSFYNNANTNFLLGFFANKNHSGLFLACILLIGFALAPQGRALRREALAWMVPGALVVMVAIVATYSRAGILLGLIALAAVGAIARAEAGRGNARLLLGLGSAMLIMLAILSTGVGERLLARFSLLDNDLRWLFWRGSWPLAVSYFPFGAGFGGFEHLFAAHEKLEWVKPTFVNNAHNDYLEVVIEAGLAGMVVVGLTIVVMARALPLAWRARREIAGRWALVGWVIVLLFAVHSLGDYPLRRLGTAALFFFAFGLVLRIFGHANEEAISIEKRASFRGPSRSAATWE